MAEDQHFDAIVIGSGQAGTPLCLALANSGIRAAMIERVHLGGTCINEGCTPTKTMIASGRVAYLARRGSEYGADIRGLRIDMKRVRKRKRDIVTSFRARHEKTYRNTPNVRLIYGQAKFTGPRAVEVRLRKGGALRITGDRIFINAGCRPSVPPLDGLKQIPFLDSTSIMELGEVPEH